MNKAKSPADVLADLGRTLYGEHWRKPLADALEINDRDLRRLIAGASLEASDPLLADALRLAREHARDAHARYMVLLTAANELSAWMAENGWAVGVNQ